MGANEISIRPAAPADAPAMMTLIKALAVYEKAPEAVTVSPEHFYESGFGPSPVWWAWVAAIPASEDREEEIVGLALYYIRYSTWKGQRLYLEDLIVREDQRGKGIGGRLMDALVTVARSKGYSGLMWQVLDWNETAIGFYKKYPVQMDAAWVNVSLEL